MNKRTAHKTGKKPAGKFNTVYRFRTHLSLKQRAERVVEARGFGDPSLLAREGVTKLIDSEEKRLGLPKLRPQKRMADTRPTRAFLKQLRENAA